MIRRLAVQVVAISLIALTALVSNAFAASATDSVVPKYKVVETPLTVGSKISEDVQCPKGMVPVGGGARTSRGTVYASDIDAHHRGWVSIVGAGSYVFSVVCTNL